MSSERPRGEEPGAERLLKINPLADMLPSKPVSLPVAKAPSLEGLKVRVPAAEDLTEEDLIVRFHEKKRAVASVRDREEGERVELGDDVLLDTLGYADGKLIPFSARFGLQTELAPMQALPGFAEAVAEGTVGGSVQALLELPEDYPVESLRGKPVRFLVDIRAAREVKLPDEEQPDFLQKLGLGDSFEEVMDYIREELEEELADELWVRARDMALEEVARRSGVEVPKELVDEEVRQRWVAAEGYAMAERGFDSDEKEEALRAWMKDPGTRQEAERRLRIGLALKAVAERDKLTLTPEKLEALLTDNVEPFGLTADDVKAALRESPETTKQLHDLGYYLMVVEHVMSKAQVSFEGAEQG